MCIVQARLQALYHLDASSDDANHLATRVVPGLSYAEVLSWLQYTNAHHAGWSCKRVTTGS